MVLLEFLHFSVKLENIFNQTSPSIPIIFILSPGQDPLEEIMKLAKQLGLSNDKFHYLSLGEHQENVAKNLLELSCANGHWMIFQNGHFHVSLLKDIEMFLEGTDNIHDDFRLWITSEPISSFPIGILQSSLKIVTESPNSLKMNLKSILNNIDEEIVNKCVHHAYKPLLYVLSFSHTVVQERQKYDKFGWNVTYDFNKSDYFMCLEILASYLTKVMSLKDSKLQWDGLKYLIGEVNRNC